MAGRIFRWRKLRCGHQEVGKQEEDNEDRSFHFHHGCNIKQALVSSPKGRHQVPRGVGWRLGGGRGWERRGGGGGGGGDS